MGTPDAVDPMDSSAVEITLSAAIQPLSRRVILDLRSTFSHKSKITQSRTQDAGDRVRGR
jgi:hypothetical protein